MLAIQNNNTKKLFVKTVKTKISFGMPKLRDVRRFILYANFDGLIDDE
jgi:hypothetical protein